MDELRECRAMLDQVSLRLIRLSAEQENIINNNSPRPSSSATVVEPAMPMATSAQQLGAHSATTTAMRGSGRHQLHDQLRARQGPSHHSGNSTTTCSVSRWLQWHLLSFSGRKKETEQGGACAEPPKKSVSPGKGTLFAWQTRMPPECQVLN